MAASEFETVEDDGFIFKIRKKRLEEIQAAAAAAAAAEEEEGAPHADPQPVAEQSFEEEKRKKRLLTLKAMYEAELKAWERLEAAATATVLEPPPSNSDNAFPAHDPQAEMLKELQIEVKSVEDYIERLQDHIICAESTYKLLVKELREDANFRPADEIVRALTGHGSTASDNNDVIATRAPLALLNTICTHRPLSTAAAAEQMVLHASAHEQGPPSSPQSSDRRGTSSC